MNYLYIIAFSLVMGVLIGAVGVVSLGSHRDNIWGTNDRLALGVRRLTGLRTRGVGPSRKADLRDHETVPR